MLQYRVLCIAPRSVVCCQYGHHAASKFERPLLWRWRHREHVNATRFGGRHDNRDASLPRLSHRTANHPGLQEDWLEEATPSDRQRWSATSKGKTRGSRAPWAISEELSITPALSTNICCDCAVPRSFDNSVCLNEFVVLS
jgi:hypothetical protein